MTNRGWANDTTYLIYNNTFKGSNEGFPPNDENIAMKNYIFGLRGSIFTITSSLCSSVKRSIEQS